MPETKYEIDFSQEADETLVRLICIEEIQNDLLKEVIKRYIKIIKEKLEKPRLEPKEIADKIQQLTNSLAIRQINIKHNTLYNVQFICFNTKTQEFDVVYSSEENKFVTYSRPYNEFTEKFKPKYGVD